MDDRVIRDSRLRDTLDYELSQDGVYRLRTYTYSPGNWLRRTCVEQGDGRDPRFRYHVHVGPVWVRVPWIVWAMFA